MNIVEQSYADLTEDAQELEFLGEDLQLKLSKFSKSLQKHKKDLELLTYNYLSNRTNNQTATTQRFLDDLDYFGEEITQKTQLETLIARKTALYDLVRVLYSETAGLITSTYWQSPSFAHSTRPQAGILTGKIMGMINDYSRDQSIPGNEYQQMFSKEFIGRWRGLPIPVFLTNSGMGALSTIISFLLREKKLASPVFMGQNSYFQNKELIVKLLPNRIVEFNENDLSEFKNKYQQELPTVIFIDTISNTANLTQPDLKQMIRFLAMMTKKETYLVIDNTCASLNFEPLKALYPTRGKLKLLVWESLNKYFQYGMDRTIGGFAWGLPQDSGALYYARMHSGTIMSEIAQAMIPTPNRKQLEIRLRRIHRNAITLVNALADKCLYRGTGGNIVLRVNKNSISRILKGAKRQNITLAAGSSFGLNISRIYLTASRTDWGVPFVRLSLGTETIFEIHKLAKLLIGFHKKGKA